MHKFSLGHVFSVALFQKKVLLVSAILLPENFAKDLSFNNFYTLEAVSYTHLRAHETKANLVCRLLLEKKKKK